MKIKKFRFLIDACDAGGIGTWSASFAAALSRAGEDAAVLALYDRTGPYGIKVPARLAGRCDVRIVSYNGLDRPDRIAAEVAARTDLGQGTVTFCMGWRPTVELVRRTGVTHLEVVHGQNCTVHRSVSKNLAACRGVVCVSHSAALAFERSLKHPLDALTIVITPGIRLPPPGRVERSAPGVRIAYVGRLTEPEKRVSRLPRLAAALASRGVVTEWHIFGEGPSRAELAHEFATNPACSALFHGFQPVERVLEGLRACDVLTLVSDHEGFPLCVVEAMAVGCVPVVAAVADLPHTVAGCGATFPPNDIDQAAEIIARLEDDRDCLTAASAASRAAAEANFNIDRQASMLAEFARSLPGPLTSSIFPSHWSIKCGVPNGAVRAVRAVRRLQHFPMDAQLGRLGWVRRIATVRRPALCPPSSAPESGLDVTVKDV